MRFVCQRYYYIFFFQAEDGIRDHCVTGVQTCALPIYSSRSWVCFSAMLAFFIAIRVLPRTVFPSWASCPRTRMRSPGSNSCKEMRSEEHTSELQSHSDLVCRLLLEKKKKISKSLDVRSR